MSLLRTDPSQTSVTGEWSAVSYTPPAVPAGVPQVGDEPGEAFDPGPPSLSGTLAGTISGATLVLDSSGAVTGISGAQLQVVSGSLSFAASTGSGTVSASGIEGATGSGTLQITLTSTAQ